MSVKRSIQIGLILLLLVASFASAGKASAWSYCGSYYYVGWGDTLFKIANWCGTTVEALRAANGIPYYSNLIYAGQYLVIPTGYSMGYSTGYSSGYSSGYGSGYAGCGPSYDYYGAYYMVCPGDTLGGIALYYGTNVSHLQWYNGIPCANRIYPGQVIRP